LKNGVEFEDSGCPELQEDELLAMEVLPWSTAVEDAKESLYEIKITQLRERTMPNPAALDSVIEMLNQERRIKEQLLGHSHEEVGSVLVMISQVYELRDRPKDSISALENAVVLFDQNSSLPSDDGPETEEPHIAGSLLDGANLTDKLDAFKCPPCTQAVASLLAHLARMQRDELWPCDPAIPNFTRAASYFTQKTNILGMGGMNERGVNVYANTAAELWKELAQIYKSSGRALEMLVSLEKACTVLECGYGPCSVESTKMWRAVAKICYEKEMFRESAIAWKSAHEGFEVNFGPKNSQSQAALLAYRKALSLKKKKHDENLQKYQYDRDVLINSYMRETDASESTFLADL